MPQKSQFVFRRPNDPYVYLRVGREMYCYDPNEELLGAGAMGEVHRGYRYVNGTWAPVVAIKEVLPAYTNNLQIRLRARQEASLAFRHPNLVEMLGCCEYDPVNNVGPIFLLSNMVQGKDIDKYVKDLPKNESREEKICRMICMVLDALDYLHNKGLVHRDIKPSNIMVEDGNNVRLMDLGIARVNGGNKFSSFGFIGTAEYAPPEQLLREQNGQNTVINGTSDIYSLGITFYELLTGKNPMSMESEAMTLDRQLHQSLPAIQGLHHPRLMQVLRKATEKEQAKRYQTAREFKQAIEEALLPTLSPAERFSEWVSRNVLPICCVVACLAVLIFFLVVIFS